MAVWRWRQELGDELDILAVDVAQCMVDETRRRLGTADPLGNTPGVRVVRPLQKGSHKVAECSRIHTHLIETSPDLNGYTCLGWGWMNLKGSHEGRPSRAKAEGC